MTDEEKNDSHDTSEGEEVDDDYLPPDAKPLCPRCLQPCDPLEYYCTNCGSSDVINPLSAYMPFVRLRYQVGFYGRLWRRITYDSDTSILIKLAFLLFMILTMPLVFLVGLPVFLITKIGSHKGR
jgi:hypothetical protein